MNFFEEVFPKNISKRFEKACLRFSVSKSAIRFIMEHALTKLKDCTAYMCLSVEKATYPLGCCVDDVEQVVHEVQDLTSQEG